MRKPFSILIVAVLAGFSLSSLTITALAADENDAVKSSRPPYKPGRQIDDDAQANAAAADDSQAVKSAKPPYKPGRELEENAAADDGAQPVTSSRPPYKPGRQAEDQ